MKKTALLLGLIFAASLTATVVYYGSAEYKGDLTVDGNLTATAGSIGNALYKGTLCASFVTTDESTMSTSFTDLSTADSCSFTLASAGTVAVIFMSNQYMVGSTASMTNEVNVDGSGQSTSDSPFDALPAGQAITGTTQFVTASLTAASHTIKVQHKVSSGTGHWRTRLMLVVRL